MSDRAGASWVRLRLTEVPGIEGATKKLLGALQPRGDGRTPPLFERELGSLEMREHSSSLWLGDG